MKLYNLYKQVILEGVEIDKVQYAINNNKAVKIVYNNGSKNSSNLPRYCQVLALGKTDRNNIALRVYQISGPNLKPNKRTGKIERYKTLLIDNIEPDGWIPTDFTFYSPPDELFNALGDKTLNISSSSGNANIAIFGGKGLDNYTKKYKQWQSDINTKQTNEPLAKDRTFPVSNDNDFEDKVDNSPIPSKVDNVPVPNKVDNVPVPNKVNNTPIPKIGGAPNKVDNLPTNNDSGIEKYPEYNDNDEENLTTSDEDNLDDTNLEIKNDR